MQTDIDYPESLPCFLREGYSLNFSDNILSSGIGGGLSDQRQLQENIPIQTQVSIIATASQAREFETWYKDTLNGIKLFNAKIKTSMGFEDMACRFVSRYSGPALTGGNLWKYTFELELYKQAIFGRDWYEYGFDFIQHSSIFDIAMNREWPEP